MKRNQSYSIMFGGVVEWMGMLLWDGIERKVVVERWVYTVYMYSAIIPSQELVGNTERQITNRTRSRQHRQ